MTQDVDNASPRAMELAEQLCDRLESAGVEPAILTAWENLVSQTIKAASNDEF